MKVEVVYAAAARTIDLCVLEMPPGSSVEQAIAASGLVDRHPELRSGPMSCGIWGRGCRADRKLVDGDRVELYRPLAIDPKEARRARGRDEKQALADARAATKKRRG
ncbi:MAG TPA: RnfH family protein [Methylibium sp.]|uniref:RnfH family protein n=1 Tax=Methylibium sp. TaxID=2067992 RepID=UPI002DB9C8A6|nr:RnfH family protein [Methylibium sp.]HEU4459712.1 RnfH family protein [Methylibium sp.]